MIPKEKATRINMKVIKVVQTFKNGILTASKKTAVQNPINPDTDKPQNTPKHHRILDLADATQVSFDAVQQFFDTLKRETRSLRKKLVAAERATNARIKERDSLKKAYLRKTQQISALKEQNEDLKAKLFAITGDLEFMEEKFLALENYRMTSSVIGTLGAITAKPTTPENIAKNTATQPAPEPARSIAANPVKKR